MRETLTVTINTPDEVLWEGEATAVSSENTDGPFDILPEHANFVTLVHNKPIRVHQRDASEVFQFERAVIYTHEGAVHVYGGLQAQYGT